MFSISGYVAVGPGLAREAFISWYEPGRARAEQLVARSLRGLDGDAHLIRRAISDEAERRTVRATPTGPYFLVDLDDPAATLVLLAGYFQPGYRVDGLPPRIDASVPEGAVA